MLDKEIQSNQQYRAFTRDDYEKWDKVQFIFMGITLLGPLKFILMMSVQVSIYLTLKFLTRQSLNENQLQKNKVLIKKYLPYFYTINNLLMGIYVINKKVKFDQQKHPKLKHYPKQKSNVIISNHVSIFDVLILLENQISAYVIRNEIKKVPIWGPIGDCYDSIYIDRKDKDNKRQIVKQIGERFNDKSKFALLVFPEGTTSNGKCLIQFKMGAFIQKKPVQFRAVKYIGNKYNPNTNMMNLAEDIMGVIFQLISPMFLYELEGSVGPEGDLNVQEYCEAIRDLYAEILNQEKTELTFQDKKDFENKYLKEAKDKLTKQIQFLIIQSKIFLYHKFLYQTNLKTFNQNQIKKF